MSSRKLYKVIAVVMAMGMVATMPMAVFADTAEQVTVEGKDSKEVDVVSNDNAETGVSMTDGEDGTSLSGSVTVKGDVSVSNISVSKSELAKDYFERNRPGAKWEEQSEKIKKEYEDYMEYCYQYFPSVGVDISSEDGSASVDIDGNITVDATSNNLYSVTTGIYSNAKSNIEVGGDVTAKTGVGKAIGVDTRGDDTSITINKGVEASSEQWAAKGVQIQGKTNLTVEGDVNASTGGTDNSSWAIGISAGSRTSEGEIKIGGDVTASGIDAEGIYINTSNTEEAKGKELKITVGGDVTATSDSYGLGIQIVDNDKKLNITVEGDITGATDGILVEKNTGEAKIVSGGTVSSTDGAAIVVFEPAEGEKTPDITVWKLESSSGSLVAAYDSNNEISKDYTEAVAKSINYIIKANDAANGQIKLTGATGKVTVGDKDYETANQGTEIIINVKADSGYKCSSLTAGQGILTKNADGTYTLTIPEGGGVELSAVLEKIRTSSGGSSSGSGTYSTTWSQDGNGWMSRKSNGSYANSEWLKLSWNGQTSWYHFNSNGYADGGWFTDTDGQKYYLYNVHDGKFGYMFTGWHFIDGKWYYFNTQKLNNASTGSLVVNGKTADGYSVDANGVWIQ